jgi:aminotransferase
MIEQHKNITSTKVAQFQESVIREMTRIAAKHGAINLGQGRPDFPCPLELKEAASQALFADVNQYAITFGDQHLREELANKYSKALGFTLDPETEITVGCGTTEIMMATLLALINSGDEIIVFEPFYENYLPQAILAGATLHYVPLQPPNWQFDPETLKKAFNNKTKAVIINTPHNPIGKVFTAQELNIITKLCLERGVFIITDEIYEHIIYDDARHIYPASLPDMRDLTITITGLSKTYSLSGWRIGWAIANNELSSAIRKIHDFLTIGAAAPLQKAAMQGIKLLPSFYTELAQNYATKRQYMMETLDKIAMPYFKPEGAYYIFADISKYGYLTDIDFARHLLETAGVAVIPGASFFAGESKQANSYVRFCFSRNDQTLQAGRERLWQAKL